MGRAPPAPLQLNHHELARARNPWRGSGASRRTHGVCGLRTSAVCGGCVAAAVGFGAEPALLVSRADAAEGSACSLAVTQSRGDVQLFGDGGVGRWLPGCASAAGSLDSQVFAAASAAMFVGIQVLGAANAGKCFGIQLLGADMRWGIQLLLVISFGIQLLSDETRRGIQPLFVAFLEIDPLFVTFFGIHLLVIFLGIQLPGAAMVFGGGGTIGSESR